MIRIYYKSGKRVSRIAVEPSNKPRLFARPQSTYQRYDGRDGFTTGIDPAHFAASWGYQTIRSRGNSLSSWHVATPKDAAAIEEIENAIAVLQSKLHALLQRKFNSWPAVTLEQAEELFTRHPEYAERKRTVLAQIAAAQKEAGE